MCCVIFTYSLATLLAARPSVNLIMDIEKLQKCKLQIRKKSAMSLEIL